MRRKLLTTLRFRTFSLVSLTALLTYLITSRFEGWEKCENGKVDVVYTWVNGSDPKFRENLLEYGNIDIEVYKQRFEDNDQLKYSLRSLEKYTDWLGHVFIVTNGQVPDWLDLNNGRVTVVTHEEIYVNRSHLPTFSSNSIETHLHRIRGLSPKFLYLNDDCFFGAPVFLDDFYTQSAGVAVFLSYLVPPCAPNCPWMFVHDGQCDGFCNVAECQFDGGDCNDIKTPSVENGTNLAPDLLRFEPRIADPDRTISELVREHNANVMHVHKMRKNRRKMQRKSAKSAENREDSYGDSLQHTNRVLNAHFGFSLRRIPCHSPILLERSIMEELQSTFPREFHTTSSHRFRHASDLQLAMVYYYYLIEATNKRDLRQVLELIDTDSSQTLNENELRTLATKLYDLPLNSVSISHYFQNVILNCTKNKDRTSFEAVKLSDLSECDSLQQQMSDWLSEQRHKCHRVKNADERLVHFKMITSNVSAVIRDLDDIRKNPKKFVCLNNNMDIVGDKQAKRVMLDFYESLFPEKSHFELSAYQRNVNLYVSRRETNEMLSDHVKFVVFMACCLLCVVMFMIKLCKRRIYHVVNYFIY